MSRLRVKRVEATVNARVQLGTGGPACSSRVALPRARQDGRHRRGTVDAATAESAPVRAGLAEVRGRPGVTRVALCACGVMDVLLWPRYGSVPLCAVPSSDARGRRTFRFRWRDGAVVAWCVGASGARGCAMRVVSYKRCVHTAS